MGKTTIKHKFPLVQYERFDGERFIGILHEERYSRHSVTYTVWSNGRLIEVYSAKII